MLHNNNIGAALVVGGGIGGMQAALDLAESGIKVYLIDNKPSIGGVMSQLDKTFPTNDCAMCTMAPRLVEIGRHKDIEILTLADIQSISGEPGNFTVSVRTKPRFVDEDKCTGCGQCVSNCPVSNIIYVTPDQEIIELSKSDQETIKTIIENHKHKVNALLLVLEDINDKYGYLPEDILTYLAQEFDYPLSTVYRLATFYNAFSLTPRGRNIIKLCMGTACYVKGGQNILNRVEKKLNITFGETTDDRSYSLESVNCLGCCGQSPVLTVNNDIYGYMKANLVSDVLGKYQHNGIR